MSCFVRLLLIVGCAWSLPAWADRLIDRHVPIISYVSFPSLDPVKPLTVSGQLRVPNPVSGPMPAVVVVHGSAGVDSRGQFYIESLNAAGIATLEIDLWAPRGWLAGTSGRPSGVPETLPDAYGALKFLAGLPQIDPLRIGIMGFSWGGVVTMLTATEPYTTLYTGNVHKFAAHVAHYPVCWVYNRVPGYAFASFTGAPVLIQGGELDTYDRPDTCPNLVASLPAAAQSFISVRMYRRATHAWDRLQPKMTVVDPFAYLGAGGPVDFIPNPLAAYWSRTMAVRAFAQAFGLDTGRPRHRH